MNNLNPQQKLAVEMAECPLLVIAGPENKHFIVDRVLSLVIRDKRCLTLKIQFI